MTDWIPPAALVERCKIAMDAVVWPWDLGHILGYRERTIAAALTASPLPEAVALLETAQMILADSGYSDDRRFAETIRAFLAAKE